MGFNDDQLQQQTFSNSKMSTSSTSLHMEEVPYFNERYPGKVCCLCNLWERSALGQGDMLKITINAESLNSAISLNKETMSLDEPEDTKDIAVIKKTVKINNEFINDLDNVGHDEVPSMNIMFEGCFMYIHSKCAMWSLQLKRIEEDFVPNFEEVIAKSIVKKCSYCYRFGASINCRMSCQKSYHLPCAAAAGCFMIIESFQSFCVDHVNQVPYIAVDGHIECRQCSMLGEISKLLMCCTCGAHYHTTCVGLANFPDSKSGWNCQHCCKCLICRQSETNENRIVKCEQCQKVYHSHCLRPIISSIPKYGWKCNRCRICTDCGSRTPGNGTSSRWHCHYTICDSCYQQRNKGFSCPMCHKAYRAASHKEMVKCSSCNKFVHSTCDEEADLAVYHSKKETNPDYDYVCPPCKMGKSMSGSSEMLGQSGDGFPRDLEAEFFDKDSFVGGFAEFTNMVDPLKISRKRIGLKDLKDRGGKVGKLLMGKGGLLSQINRKRNVRGKGRQLLMLNSNNSTSNTSANDLNSTQCSEDDMSLEKKIVLCSAKDKFILMQDICVSCGAMGTDQESCLISCVQCGQCYHPHCANVTLSKTMLQKGWRCLDCTVCEGCGQKNDEGRLILCDECDISYHIYCMVPPLDAVPNGNWKCKWCAVCLKCGRDSPGKNSQWFNGFQECGPCASQAACFVCSQKYNENELIIQCSTCDRWLHCLCDNIKNEDEVKAFEDSEYNCKTCRKDKVNITKAAAVAAAKAVSSENTANPKTTVNPVVTALLSSSSSHANNNNNHNNNNSNNSNTDVATLVTTTDSFEPSSTENTFWIDGVCVSEQGFNMIRSLTTEIKKKRKLRTDTNQKDASGILSAIDSVIDGRTDGNTTPTPTAYKDGMVWQGEEGTLPEGFSISTNEEGLNILRKKRQRNLQKLGIGGFNVRLRGVRKETEELYMDTLENPSLTDEKKKKIIKKKIKSKITESYPSYLQEAFFGKTLLDNKDAGALFNDSESSDNEINLGLSKDLLNIKKEPSVFSANQQQQQQQQQHLNQSMGIKQVTEDKATDPNINLQQKLLTDLQKSSVISNVMTSATIKTEVMDSPQQQQQQQQHMVMVANSTPNQAQMEEKLNALKTEDILGHASNETFSMVSGNSMVLDNTTIKAEIGQSPIIQQHSNVHNVPQQQQQQLQHQQQTFLQNNPRVMNNLQQMQNLQDNQMHQLSQQQQQMSQQQHLHAQLQQAQIQQQHQQQQQQQQPTNRVTYQSQYQQMTSNVQASKHPFLTQKSEDPMLSQIKIERDVMLAQTVPGPTLASTPTDSRVITDTSASDLAGQLEEPVKETAVAGTQKTAEKMRKDEDLGEMATISAVLYANTQHPELKHLYPNWNERCKQILKKWRSLSTEMKGPFLQQAKDNRSVLRLKRSQQEPEKVYFQQKSLKEQEQERVWKQHQAKNKETYGNKFYKPTGDFPRPDPHTPPSMVLNQAQQQQLPQQAAPSQSMFGINLLQDDGQNKIHNQLLSANDQLQQQQQQHVLINDHKKALSQIEQQQTIPYMTSSLNPTLQQQQQPTQHISQLQQQQLQQTSNHMDPMTLQLSERNDIFLTDKNWTGMSKLTTDSKDPMTSGVEKLEADENAGLGDILGGFGEGDDDDILKSLTAEICDDFNILEYADPELDELNGSQNLLNKLDFDENQKPI